VSDEQAPAHRAGARLGLRAALIALIVVGAASAVLVVVLLSGDGEQHAQAPTRPVTAADPKCVDAWNADAKQTELSRHEATDHQTTKAWVLVLDFDGQRPPDPAQGDCAVVFPGAAFGDRADDPRHVAQIRNGDAGWEAVRDLPAVTPKRIRELQTAAAEQANVSVGADGRLTRAGS
jgi:hypothetical protein